MERARSNSPPGTQASSEPTRSETLARLEAAAQQLGVSASPIVQRCLRKLRRAYDPRYHQKLVAFLSNPARLFEILRQGELPLVEALGFEGQRLPPGQVLALSLAELTQGGGLITGNPGTGKSVFALLLLASLRQLAQDFLAFDPKGFTYRGVAQRFDRVVCLPYLRLRLNLLQPPPGVSPGRWAKCLAFLFAEQGLIQSIGFLQELLVRLYQQHENPHLGHLTAALEQASTRQFNAKTSWMDTARGVVARVRAGLGECLQSTDNQMLETLLQPGVSVVIETRGLYDLAGFLISFLLMWLYEGHLERGEVGGHFRRLILFEEGQMNVARERGNHPATQSASFLEQMVVTGQRETGLPLVTVAQNYSKVSVPIRSNVFFSAAFHSSPDDVQWMRHLGTSRELVPQLEQRAVLIALRERVPNPVLGRTFDAPPELLEPVSDEALAGMMAPIWGRLDGLWTPIPSVPTGVSAKPGNNKPKPTPKPDEKPSSKQPSTTQPLLKSSSLKVPSDSATPSDADIDLTTPVRATTTQAPQDQAAQTPTTLVEETHLSSEQTVSEQANPPEETDVQANADIALSAEEVHFITTLVAHPLDIITTLYEYLKPAIKSKTTAVKIQKSLAAKGLLHPPILVECKGRGRPHILVLTELGYQWVEAHYGKRKLHRQPRGSELHSFLLDRLANMLRVHHHDAQVTVADTRLLGSGREVDVTLQDEQGMHAYEVALHISNMTPEHLQQRLDAGYVDVTILCESKNLNKLQEQLNEMAQVKVVSLKSFLELSPEQA